MEVQQQIPLKTITTAAMLKRVARFKDLKGFDGGLPDSYMPGSERILYNVIGFQPPPGNETEVFSPVGGKAARMAAIKISEGFNLGYCEALPGHGPLMHNHDTNETFIAITGRWRGSWEDENGNVEHVDLDPLDVISFPPGLIRRFQNVTDGPKDQYSVLMFVIAGDQPGAEFSPAALAAIAAHGLSDGATSDDDNWIHPHNAGVAVKLGG